MRRQRARTLAQCSILTGLPPSEIRGMTQLELAAYVDTLVEVRRG